MDLLIDTNIILDILQNREPFVQYSQHIFNLIKEKKYTGILASHTITNLWYILRKTHTIEQRRTILLSLLELFEISALTKIKLKNALLRTDFSDFEDCLQDECGIEYCADYIITRNPSDYEKSTIRCISPQEFIQLKGV